MKVNKSISVVILSFDDYKDAWDPFFKLFEKNWTSNDYNIYLVTNFESYDYLKNLKIIKTGAEISWKRRAIKSLESIETDYVLLLLEDYFIKEKVSAFELEKFIDTVIENKYKYTRLVNNPFNITDLFKGKKLYPINKNEEYGINLQPSIWDRAYLLDTLKIMKGSTAWEFEKYFLDKVDLNSSEKIESHVKTSYNFLKMKNGILRGKWFWSTKYFFRKHSIKTIKNSKHREKLNFLQEFFYVLKVYARIIIPKKIKKRFKKGK